MENIIKELQRYNISGYGQREKSDNGKWVLFSDIEVALHSASNNTSQLAIALCKELYTDIESSEHVTIFSGSERAEKLKSIFK